ncbi:MAG: hypothetical protein WDN00_18110 [Limisphaerales bacterium]
MEEAPAVDPADAELDATPATIAEALALLARVQAMPDRDSKSFRKLKSDRIEKLRRHHYILCNADAKGEPKQNLCDRAQTIFTKVVTDAAEPIAKLRELTHAYRCVYGSFKDKALLPNDQKRHLDLIDTEIGEAVTADEIDILLMKKSRVLAVSQTLNATIAAARIINKSFDAIKPVIEDVEAAFKLSLDQHEAELIDAEKKFFEGQGVKHQRTGVSNVIASVRNRLKELTASFHNELAHQERTRDHARICKIEDNAFKDLFQVTP